MKKWNQQYHEKFKAFALIHKVWDQKNLEKSWKRVKANRGSAGIDNITIEQFEQNLQQNLAEIQRLLKEKRYEPSPVLRVMIPKDNGKMRKLQQFPFYHTLIFFGCFNLDFTLHKAYIMQNIHITQIFNLIFYAIITKNSIPISRWN